MIVPFKERHEAERPIGQAVTEFALLFGGVVLPLTFMVVFMADAVDLAQRRRLHPLRRALRRHALLDVDASNVIAYMKANVPPMVDRISFRTGRPGISIPKTPTGPRPSTAALRRPCVPDTVSVSVTNYQFMRFTAF